MNKEQALYSFWRQFAEAYDETSVPDSAGLPRLTYEGITDDFGYSAASTISIFSRSSSWSEAENIKNEIESTITRGGCMVKYDGGAMWIKKANPFAQRMSDSNDDMMRIIIINIEYEFIS